MTVYHQFAPAKINLFLHVVGKEETGYHHLESLFCFAAYGDYVTFTPSEQRGFTITYTGPYAAPLAAESDNLVLKAARLFASHVPQVVGGHFELEKNLPIASGIGGGSADAAATLHALNAASGQLCDEAMMHRLGRELGADVPPCLVRKSLYIKGRGDVDQVVTPFPTLPVVLVNPLQHVSTPQVFKQYQPHFTAPLATKPLGFETAEALLAFLKTTSNDLYPPAAELLPILPTLLEVIQKQPNCLLARMSGSGATCFGIFPTETDAHQAAAQLAHSYPEWWVKAMLLNA